MLSGTDLRVLAIDLRSGRFGFAVLESPRRLLEWGVRRWHRGNSDTGSVFIRKRIALLVKLFAPSMIVVTRMSGRTTQLTREHLLKALMDEAQRHSLELMFVEPDEIQLVFAAHGSITKSAIAAHIALLFPELTWKLPSARKPWETESHNSTIFNAISLGLTCLSRFAAIDASPGDSPTPRPQHLA